MRGPERTLAAGLKRKMGQKGVRREGIKEKCLLFLKSLQTIEFKCKFEFKHFKTMHQHVCNIKLL
jgi:hypothetical protein